LAEQIELNGWVEQAGLVLSPAELDAFARVTAEFDEIREAYEVRIAKSGQDKKGLPKLEIPLYANAGDALRNSFYAALRSAMGEELAAKIQEKLGSQLEGRFAGFGTAVQTVHIRSEASPVGATEVAVERVSRYASQDGAGDRVLTRKETDISSGSDSGEGSRWSGYRSALGLETVSGF